MLNQNLPGTIIDPRECRPQSNRSLVQATANQSFRVAAGSRPDNVTVDLIELP
jgi:hypothetical protein